MSYQAGLFSAVVTTFVVDSYKALQPDPNEAVLALLFQIATRLDPNRPQNDTAASEIPTPTELLDSQSATPAASRVNALWFISLVLSLTVVLVGTVALQWLREHQRYPVQILPRYKFAIFNMRREGLRAWYVPQIFSVLPMVLQLSLVLFLVGLIDFLVSIVQIKVIIPILTVIALPIFFIVLTTTMPSFQKILTPPTLLWLFKRVPSQCPYRSPQSSAFTLIFTWLVLFWGNCVFAFLYLCRLYFSRIQLIEKVLTTIGYWTSVLENFTDFKADISSLPAIEADLNYRSFCFEEEYRNKLSTGTAPDNQKTLSLFLPFPMSGMKRPALPIYDWVAGLHFANAESNKQLDIQAVYLHCIQDLLTINQRSFDTQLAWLWYIRSRITGTSQISRTISDYYIRESIPSEVVQEELIAKSVLEIFDANGLSPEKSTRLHEVYIRIMKYYLPQTAQVPLIKLDDSTRVAMGNAFRMKTAVKDYVKQPVPSSES